MKKILLLPVFLLTLGIGIGLGFGEDAPKPQEKKDDVKLETLVEQLGADRFEKREAAFGALKKAGEEARPLLKKALESEDVEIRWRASRLLSHLDGKKVKAPALEVRPDDSMTSLKKRLEELHKRMPQEDLFFKDLFEDWPGKDPFKGDADIFLHKRLSDPDMFSFHFFSDDIFKEMEKMMEELGQAESDLRIEIGGQKAQYHMERRDDQGSEVCKLEMAEDGSVKASITRIDQEGKTEEKIYEAESMEEFKASHPEVAKAFSLDRFSFGGSAMKFNWPPVMERQGKLPKLTLSPKPESQRRTLGIYVDPDGIDKVLRTHLGLRQDEGLVVRKVLPGSLAEKIGLKPHDVILSIQSRSVSKAEDIGMALSSLKMGDEVKLIIIRNGKRITLTGKSEFPDNKPI